MKMGKSKYKISKLNIKKYIINIGENNEQLRNYYEYHPQLKFKDSVFDFTKYFEHPEIIEKTILRIKEFNKSWKPYQFGKSPVNELFKENLKRNFKISEYEFIEIEIIRIDIAKSNYGNEVVFTFIKIHNEYKLLYINESLVF